MTTPSDAQSTRLAWKSPAAVALFVVLATLALAADLWTKHAVFSNLLSPVSVQDVLDARRSVIKYGEADTSANALIALRLTQPGPMGTRLTLSTNSGVVFGLPVPRWVVIIATAVTVLALGAFFAFSPSNHRWLHVGKALILAGALGNLYDRMATAVVLPGAEAIRCQVRDFLDFSAWGYPWIFNIADVWLVVGVAMVMLYWWFHPSQRRTKAES